MIKDSNSKLYEVEVGCIIHTVPAVSEDHARQQMAEQYQIKPSDIRDVRERV
jgi:hypothetical protein